MSVLDVGKEGRCCFCAFLLHNSSNMVINWKLLPIKNWKRKKATPSSYFKDLRIKFVSPFRHYWGSAAPNTTKAT